MKKKEKNLWQKSCQSESNGWGADFCSFKIKKIEFFSFKSLRNLFFLDIHLVNQENKNKKIMDKSISSF